MEKCMNFLLLCCISLLPALAQSSSPFKAPDTNDQTFVADSGPYLDTGCTFRSGGPLVIEVPIDRYVGEVDANGFLVDPTTLDSLNVLSLKATLRLPAWDIDLYGGGTQYQPEIDRITLNGHDLGNLTGDDGIWKMNEFDITTDMLKFPRMGSSGTKPTAAVNEIKVHIDEANSEEVWCMSLDWVEITISAMAPVLLVHGTNAQSDSWVPDFTTALTTLRVPHSNDIDLAANGTIDGNARLLKGRVNALAKSFGAESVHLVGHSKGGLDSRRFLGSYYTPKKKGHAKVLSLYTIGTPHHGTMLSDLSVANRTYNDPQSGNATVQEYLDNDWWADAFGQGPQEPALSQQTQANMASFNATNTFPSGVNFYTFSGDADANGDGTISVAEATPLIPNAWYLDASEIATLMYNVLGNVASITVTRHTNWGGWNEWHVLTPTAPPAFLKNDLVVTLPSSRHTAGMELLSLLENHSSVKNATVAGRIRTQIQTDFPVK